MELCAPEGKIHADVVKKNLCLKSSETTICGAVFLKVIPVQMLTETSHVILDDIKHSLSHAMEDATIILMTQTMLTDLIKHVTTC